MCAKHPECLLITGHDEDCKLPTEAPVRSPQKLHHSDDEGSGTSSPKKKSALAVSSVDRITNSATMIQLPLNGGSRALFKHAELERYDIFVP